MKNARFAWLALLFAAGGVAALPESIDLRGYLLETSLLRDPSFVVDGGGGARFNNMLHSRGNLRWYPIESAAMGVEGKLRLFTGEDAASVMEQAEMFGGNDSFFDWEKLFFDEENALFSGALDRAWITGYAGDWQATLGRQRIAWGTNLVWNPIDLFNPSSPFDFENEEKPGIDAARVQYYLGPASRIEAAVAPMREGDRMIAAAELILNRWEYDWAVMGGRRASTAVFGGAWVGHIRGGGFRGEALYSIPRRAPAERSGEEMNDSPCLLASIDGDYTFPTTLYLHGAVLYNEKGTTGDAGGPELLEAYERKRFTSGRFSLFAEIAREIGPLVRVDLAAIGNPHDRSWYCGPSIAWSVVTNLDLTAIGFIFDGRAGTEFGDNGDMILMKLKYSF